MSGNRRIPTRRQMLALAGAAGAATLALPGRSFAQAKKLTVLSHRVHHSAATSGPGGDATAAWRASTGTDVDWVTLGDVNAIMERLLREASLSETSIDVGYLLNGRAVPRNLRLFEPLDARQSSAPIEAFNDFAPGLVEPLKLEGALYGVPVRHATNALIYNEALFEERGVALPKTFEELVEAARKLTYKRADGTPVYGLAFTSVFASNFLSLSRALGGDYMTADGKIVCTEPGMVKTLGILADLYKSGVMPRNFTNLNNEEVTTWMQQGRAAITVNPFARLVSYNDPSKSQYPGKFKALTVPVAADLQGKLVYAPTVEFWALVIPKVAKQKDASWGLISALSSKAGTLAMALNGNGPTRLSTYDEPKLKAALPYAADEAAALKTARIHLPAFDEQARAHDIFVQASQAAVIGSMPPEAAMADAAARVKPLLPT
ncbi:Multiple sugar transport system substrate-binding protein [Hyphomicrobiales bacterium]|nr:Multiple sugar transport system substrate-binding protein [Hyphomicrobiales bacterium]CAH1664238.1 Multiple sugar transport system substrate-binding protein [Hyphomicrobiales bacterium]